MIFRIEKHRMRNNGNEELFLEILMAKTAGFCFGVTKAVEKVYENIGKYENLYTYGPIIHNESVVNDLEKKGVFVIRNEKELENINGGTIVIRSHGVSEEIYGLIEKQNCQCIDATCPFVKRIHKIVKERAKMDMKL